MRAAFAPLLTVALSIAATSALAQDAPPYPTPQEAVEALAAAFAATDPERLVRALGPGAENMVTDPDLEVDPAALADLDDLYREGYRFVPTEAGIVLEFGAEGWPFPVPLVPSTEGWTFDLEAGRDEIARREVGRNELDVIELLSAYVEVQRAFREVDHDGDGVLEFASSLLSPAEARSGLHWDGDDAPVGDLAARASLDGFTADDDGTVLHEPHFGYYYRVLTGQGPHAPGGAFSYLVKGQMLAGHALLAVPADYGVTGVHTFLVAEAGTVYEADLGEASLDIAFELELFDPDPSLGWTPLD